MTLPFRPELLLPPWCRARVRDASFVARSTIFCAVAAFATLGSASPVAGAVTPVTITITTTTLANAEVGAAYTSTVAASGGTPPYTWSVASGIVPTGLTFSKTGILSGLPKVTSIGPLSVAVTDSAGVTATAALSFEIDPGPTVTTVTLPNPVVGSRYLATLTASGGTPPYSWSVTSGPLPEGMVLNSTGFLSGIPSVVGATTTTVAVTDALGSRTSAPLTVTVAATLTAPGAYFTTSTEGDVSAYASPGVSVPQTTTDGPSGVVGIATDALGDRYWVATASGQVFASTNARSLGSIATKRLSGRIVGIAATSDGTGYWLVSSTGHVYGFGSARSLGSVRPSALRGSVVAIAAKSDGTGYWLVSSIGHVYGFGSAHTLHERGKAKITAGIVGIAAGPGVNGYWIVNRAGRVYAFGAVGVSGSVPPRAHLRSVVAIAADPDGGYWVVARGGHIYSFGATTTFAGIEVASQSNVIAIASAT